jgi:formimidoylglutamate deiminase
MPGLMTTLFARKALLHKGWADDVRIRTEGGRIVQITADQPADPDDTVAGIVIPGMANAHSHAFQRALAGHTEQRSPKDRDNFWTWRSRMYRLAGLVDADRLTAIARQAYSEMLTSGYTAVAEFHYLHSEPGGSTKSTAMLQAIATAAADTGIRLTYVPVLYERAGFDQPEPTDEQRRFSMTIEDFVTHYERARDLAGPAISVAIGAHSLRAVTKASLTRIAKLAKRDNCPMHLHIAEQTSEVEQCIARHGMRPVAWLFDEFSPDENWCLVHATHIDKDEIEALSNSGAVVCLCPSTEANLGDGLFPLQPFLAQNGRIAIGSDSHISINPFEELRWLEYGQRLVAQERNIAAIRRTHTGRSLFEETTSGGAQACGNGSGDLKKGEFADLVVLDDQSPMLVGHDKESILDALVFSGFTLPIDRVMVNGEWQVLDGDHVAGEWSGSEYARVVRELIPEIQASQ